VSRVDSLHVVRAPVICLEGPSAVGKTSLAAALARAADAAVVPESNGAPPPGVEQRAWFLAQHVAAWARALTLAGRAPLVVLDGDPFKGLWFDWIFAAGGAPALDAVIEAHANEVARGALGFPDLYVLLGATEVQLRQRRADDSTRSRRHFETHLRLVEPQRRYFVALADAAPGRVLWLDTTERGDLASAVLAAVAALPPDPPDAVSLLRDITSWLAGADRPFRSASAPAPDL
jgi:thymidylate kinase